MGTNNILEQMQQGEEAPLWHSGGAVFSTVDGSWASLAGSGRVVVECEDKAEAVEMSALRQRHGGTTGAQQPATLLLVEERPKTRCRQGRWRRRWRVWRRWLIRLRWGRRWRRLWCKVHARQYESMNPKVCRRWVWAISGEGWTWTVPCLLLFQD